MFLKSQSGKYNLEEVGEGLVNVWEGLGGQRDPGCWNNMKEKAIAMMPGKPF